MADVVELLRRFHDVWEDMRQEVASEAANEIDRLRALDAKSVAYQVGSLRVESRGSGLWCVSRDGAVRNTCGEWEYEPLPSRRDDDFITRTRFTKDVALAMAAELVEPR